MGKQFNHAGTTYQTPKDAYSRQANIKKTEIKYKNKQIDMQQPELLLLKMQCKIG